jgi:hypothetical protein
MIDMSALISLLDQVDEEVNHLDGLNMRDLLQHDQQLRARKAEVSRRLLLLSHLLDNARLEAMNQYHAWRGEDHVPRVVTT